MDKEKVFLKISELNKNLKYPLEGYYCKCGKPAEYILYHIDIIDIYYRRSTYCSDCVVNYSKKNNAQLVETWNEIEAIKAEREVNKQQEFEEAKKRILDREREILKKEGKILRLSGYDGWLYEMADGSLLCEMRNGENIQPCCWRNGVHLIKNDPRRLHQVPEHNNNCKNYLKTSPKWCPKREN